MDTKNSFSGTFCTIGDRTNPGTALTSGEVNISARKYHHRPVSFPAYLSKVVVKVSRKNSTAYLDNYSIFSLAYHPSLAQLKATTFSSTYSRTGAYAWQKRGGACVGFLLSYNSFLQSRSISSLFFALNSTVQYTAFTKPPILLTAPFWVLPS